MKTLLGGKWFRGRRRGGRERGSDRPADEQQMSSRAGLATLAWRRTSWTTTDQLPNGTAAALSYGRSGWPSRGQRARAVCVCMSFLRDCVCWMDVPTSEMEVDFIVSC